MSLGKKTVEAVCLACITCRDDGMSDDVVSFLVVELPRPQRISSTFDG